MPPKTMGQPSPRVRLAMSLRHGFRRFLSHKESNRVRIVESLGKQFLDERHALARHVGRAFHSVFLRNDP